MALKDNLLGFEYFPFLKQLLSKGQCQWTTPEKAGEEVFLTRLYLDGDILCWFFEGEQPNNLDVPPELLKSHTQKIDRDLKSINKLSKQLSLVVAFLITTITFILNPSGWLENIIAFSGLGIAGYLSRNLTRKVLFKIIGAIAGLLMKKNKSLMP